MPPDVVTIVSTGIGVSVIAGVISGVCYILAHGFTKKGGLNAVQQWHCAVCGRYLRSYTSDNIRVVICTECEERVCKQRCSRRDHVRKGWICYSCIKQPSWLHNIIDSISFRHKRNKSADNMITQHESSGEQPETSGSKTNKEKECVRDFIEKIVSTIVGGSVDDASIFRLYRDKHYNTLFSRYHQDLSDAITDLSSALQISLKNASVSETSPSSAHTNLKLLIEKILHETGRFPNFRKAVDNPATSSEEQNTYEELLATAILNKIISKHNDVPPSPTENVNKEFEGWRTNWKHTDLESTSTSSLDDYLQSDSSLGSTKYVDHLSLTIQQRIEEIPSSGDDVDGDIKHIRPRNSQSDQSNWYLQKRQFHGTMSPVPVPMLVPNPLTTAKVLIGDKEIDETSDLSDATSEDENLASEAQNLLIDSTVVISGGPFTVTSSNYFSDEDTSFDSGVRDDRDDFSDKEKFYAFEPKGDESAENVSVISSRHSNIENDFEYLEKYASLPKTVVKRGSPSLNSSSSAPVKEADGISYKMLDHQDEIEDDQYTQESQLFEGSYSKKDKEKWNHPVNMPYNPYTEENIRKRIRTSQTFGRDYYTKQASLPSGRAKSDEVSLSNRIDQLEARYTYSSLPRSLYTPRNSTRNFVKNPLLHFPENHSS